VTGAILRRDSERARRSTSTCCRGRQLLSVAANHAATAFRMARLVDDHRRAEAALKDSEQQLRKTRDELETKVAERTAALRRSESYLTEAQRLSHTGTWAFNPTTTLYWSEENYRIWGLDPLLERFPS
jgi:C4-dicarboxylate-specific signal transduction histidine kinase